MAASVCGREVAFFAFGDADFAEEFAMVHSLLRDHQVTVGALYRMVLEYAAMVREGNHSLYIFHFLSARAC